MKKKTIISFGAASLLVLFGVSIQAVPGYSFSGLICFGIAALVLGYWFLSLYRGRTARWIRRCLTAVLILGVLLASVTGVMIGLAGRGDEEESCQYVIVLGAGVNGTSPSLILRERLDATLSYLNANPQAICVLSGGQGSGENITEAACMYNFLTEKGIDPNRLWMEEKATSTWENIDFSLRLIEEKTGTRPASAGIISNEFHLFRAEMMAERQQLDAIGIPAKTTWVSLRINYFLREILAVWKLMILGG